MRAKASMSSATVWGRNALRTSGRLMVTLAIPVPDCSKRMSRYSRTGVQVAGEAGVGGVVMRQSP